MSPRMKKSPAEPAAEKNVYTRRELAADLVADLPGLGVQQSRDIVEVVVAKLRQALLDGKDIQFREFGTLERVVRKSRPGRNPRNPTETCVIPARVRVRFKQGAMLKAALNKQTS